MCAWPYIGGALHGRVVGLHDNEVKRSKGVAIKESNQRAGCYDSPIEHAFVYSLSWATHISCTSNPCRGGRGGSLEKANPINQNEKVIKIPPFEARIALSPLINNLPWQL